MTSGFPTVDSVVVIVVPHQAVLNSTKDDATSRNGDNAGIFSVSLGGRIVPPGGASHTEVLPTNNKT